MWGQMVRILIVSDRLRYCRGEEHGVEANSRCCRSGSVCAVICGRKLRVA